MKNTLVVFIALFLFSTITLVQPDQRVIDYLGIEKVNIIKESNPDLIHYYNFFLDNCYSVNEVPSEKLIDNNLPTLTLPLKAGKVDTKKLNVLLLNIQRSYDESKYFKVEGTSQIFIMLSEKQFIKKFNEHRKTL